MIQDLNKEIEYHDKVINVLLGSVPLDLRETCDEEIMEALSNGKSLERHFYLREELLEQIKSTKKRIVAYRKKIEA